MYTPQKADLICSTVHQKREVPAPVYIGAFLRSPSPRKAHFSPRIMSIAKKLHSKMASLCAWGESVCQRWRRPWRKDTSFQSWGWLSAWVREQQSWRPRHEGSGASPCWRECWSWARCAWPACWQIYEVPAHHGPSPGMPWKAAANLGSQLGESLTLVGLSGSPQHGDPPRSDLQLPILVRFLNTSSHSLKWQNSKIHL